MRYSWSYLENMSVYRIDPRKMAVALDDSKRVNGKLNQLKDHLIEIIQKIQPSFEPSTLIDAAFLNKIQDDIEQLYSTSNLCV